MNALPEPQSPAPLDAPARPLSFPDAMSLARRTVALFTELAVDGVVSCARREGGWTVVVDAIESPARMGDNDLIATYQVLLAGDGEVEGFERTGRYHRSDAARA